MKATEITRRYHESWNGRDADALVANFTKGGTFCSPETYPGVSGEALAAYVKGLWTAFPDFHLELLNAGEIELGLVARQGFEIKQKLNPPGPSALIQTPGLPVSQP